MLGANSKLCLTLSYCRVIRFIQELCLFNVKKQEYVRTALISMGFRDISHILKAVTGSLMGYSNRAKVWTGSSCVYDVVE
jgi:hypothetical protein